MSLANKYRPINFDKIIGQEHITDIIKAQIKSEQKNNHNYLFFGPRGTGKTSAARILAKALNCTNLSDGNPCNNCDNCNTINQSKTLDFVEIDAASHTGVENIREEILSKIDYPPTQLKKKIYIIDEVHMLSTGAFNALLKTIEEPKDNMCFILATTEIHKVPDTIVSRCQVFNFKKILGDKMISLLQGICEGEGLKHDENALKMISKISEGCVRDAVKYIDQVSVFGEINEENTTKFLGIANDSTIKDFLDLIKKGERNKIFEKIDEIYNQGIDLLQFAKQNLMYIDQNITQDTDFLLKVSEAFSEIIGTIKYYPYPTIVYKIAINKKFGVQNLDKVEESELSTPKKNIQTETPKTQETKNIEETKPEKPNIKYSNDEIMSKLIDAIESKTLQDNLRNHTIAKKLGDGVAHFVVINKMAEMLLKKEDTKKLIENKLFEITGKSLIPKIEFQSKEDYFANQL